MQELDDLRTKAEAVLENLGSSPRERPVFVEFSGSPKSGKSTCIEIVAHFFRRVRSNGERFNVLAPTEGASRRTPYFLRDDLVAFNTWSASYALTHILEGLYHSDRYHLAILDRGLFDALAWFHLLESRGEISSGDRDRVQDFLQISHWRSVVDAVFLFTADPDTSMERENADKLIAEPGRAMNPETLSRLNQAYLQAQGRFAGEFSRFIEIDTSFSKGTTPRSTAYLVADTILELFKA